MENHIVIFDYYIKVAIEIMQTVDKQNKTCLLQHLFIQKLIKYQLSGNC